MNSLILKLAMINLFSLNFSLYHFGLRATPGDRRLTVLVAAAFQTPCSPCDERRSRRRLSG
mgnify:CR=1 FL=1